MLCLNKLPNKFQIPSAFLYSLMLFQNLRNIFLYLPVQKQIINLTYLTDEDYNPTPQRCGTHGSGK
jgi:hypothetical protein